MPTIAEAVNTDTSGYQRMVPQQPPILHGEDLMVRRDANQICSSPYLPGIFPSTNNIVDFGLGGKTPQWRAPIPAQPTLQGSGTASQTTVVSSGGGASVITSLPQIQTGALNIPALNPGDQFQGSVGLTGEAWNFFNVNASGVSRIRAYATDAAQSADQFRDVFTPPGLATFQDLIFDVILDTPPLIWDFGGLTGNNNAAGVSQLIWITVDNISNASEPAGIVTVTYSPLAA